MNNILRTRSELVTGSVLLAVFVLVRLFFLNSDPQLADHDSVTYLYGTKAVLSDGILAPFSFRPDHTPFYPIVSGLVSSLLDIPPEMATRVVSLLFSCFALCSVFYVFNHLFGLAAATVGGIFLAFDPYWISFSISILSEPVYVGGIYLTLALFLEKINSPSFLSGAALGVILGASFLNRTEPILFVLLLPLLQALHWYFIAAKSYPIKQLLAWCLGLILLASIPIGTQIFIVSEKMNGFNLNGRQAWSSLLNAPDGKTYDQKIYGLDYSDKAVNLDYLQANPEELSKLPKRERTALIKLAVNNFQELYHSTMVSVVPLAVIALALLGVFGLLRRHKHIEVMVLVAFFSTAMVAPLFYNIMPRYIAILSPLLCMLAGVGVLKLGHAMAGYRERIGYSISIVALIMATLTPSLVKIRSEAIKPTSISDTYSRSDFDELARVIEYQEDSFQPVIAARTTYLAYFVDAIPIYLPYATLENAMNFFCEKRVDYIFLEYARVKKYPFIDDLGAYPEYFVRVYEGLDNREERLELYRFESPRICPLLSKTNDETFDLGEPKAHFYY